MSFMIKIPIGDDGELGEIESSGTPLPVHLYKNLMGLDSIRIHGHSDVRGTALTFEVGPAHVSAFVPHPPAIEVGGPIGRESRPLSELIGEDEQDETPNLLDETPGEVDPEVCEGCGTVHAQGEAVAEG